MFKCYHISPKAMSDSETTQSSTSWRETRSKAPVFTKRYWQTISGNTCPKEHKSLKDNRSNSAHTRIKAIQ